MQLQNNPLTICDVYEKLRRIDVYIEQALKNKEMAVPELPGRDVAVCAIRDLPPKAGLSSWQGQARLLHDLASIELQAMELGFRTLIEYPEAPDAMRAQLAEVTREEASHLRLCLEGLERLGSKWGEWPVHIGLWQSVATTDNLLDRILIVHRFLEGSGLDAGQVMARRMTGVKNSLVRPVLEVINRDEIKHVNHGSHWFKELCRQLRLDADYEFKSRLQNLFPRLPRRLEPIDEKLRAQVGFSSDEIETLKELQRKWFAPEMIHNKLMPPSIT